MKFFIERTELFVQGQRLTDNPIMLHMAAMSLNKGNIPPYSEQSKAKERFFFNLRSVFQEATGKSIWDECMSECPWRVKSYSSTMKDKDGNLKHMCKATKMECSAVNCAPYMMFSGKETVG